MRLPEGWFCAVVAAQAITLSLAFAGEQPVGYALAEDLGANEVTRGLSSVIDSWTARTGVTLAQSARDRLILEARSAVGDIERARPNAQPASIEAALPHALAKYLDRSLEEDEVPSIRDLTEQELSGSGLLLKRWKLFRILIVTIDPTDAELTINGYRYRLSPVSKYGIDAEKATVEVRKEGFKPCQQTVELKPDADTQVSCILAKQ